MAAIDRYKENINQPVPPGYGCHAWKLSTSNLGVIAGLDPQHIYDDILAAIPPGHRRQRQRGVAEAVQKALSDHGNGKSFGVAPEPRPIIPQAVTFETIAAQGKYGTEDELVKASPITIPEDPAAQQRLFFETIFQVDDFVFCGDCYNSGTDKTIRPVCEWLEVGAKGPFIIVNPFTGMPGLKKDGKLSYRCDMAVKRFPHALVEFDNQTIEAQIMFWSAAKLPIKCLIHTAGKSIHAWLDLSKLNIITMQQWGKIIKVDLYERRLKPLGVDMQCSNAARLSRLPGVYRAETKRWQRLLWLSAEGRNVG